MATKHQPTVHTVRCRIQDLTVPGGDRRYSVVWDQQRDAGEPPLRIVCRTKRAARQLAICLDDTDVLWTY